MNVYDHNENQPQNGTLVWVVDDDAIRWVLEKALNKAGYTCVSFENGAQVLDALKVASQNQPFCSLILKCQSLMGCHS